MYRCDRCKKEIEGFETDSFTAGFYYVDGGYWSRYARPKADTSYETVICDECMWTDDRYIADWGIKGGDQHYSNGSES